MSRRRRAQTVTVSHAGGHHRLEEADFECATDVRQPLLTVLVAGGGFAGVETVAAVNDFVHEAVRFYPNITLRDVRVAVVHPGPYLLPELGEELGRYTHARLAERGIEVLLNTRVTGINGSRTVLSNGMEIDARTVVWTAGTSNPLLDCIPCQRSRGRLVVNEFLQSPDMPNVGPWATARASPIRRRPRPIRPPRSTRYARGHASPGTSRPSSSANRRRPSPSRP